MEFRSRTLEGLVVNPQFWKNKNVLLTGHTGFKGSWLSLWLKNMGVNLVGYSLKPPTDPSLFELANIEGSFTTSRVVLRLARIRPVRSLRGARIHPVRILRGTRIRPVRSLRGARIRPVRSLRGARIRPARIRGSSCRF